MKIFIHHKRVVWALAIIAAALVVLSVTANFLTYSVVDNPLPAKVTHNFERLFDLDSEANVPTWFQVALLLTCAGLLAINAGVHKTKNESHAIYWMILSVAFLYLSIDELASIHDMANAPVKQLLHSTSGILRFAWVIPYGILTGIFGLANLKFLFNLPRKTAMLFIVAGIIYVGSSIGIELLGGMYSAIHGEENFNYKLIATVEESGEMVGLILFIFANLDYINTHVGEVLLQLEASTPKSSTSGEEFRAAS